MILKPKMNKLLLIYKTVDLDNTIYNITKSYCNNFLNIEAYFLIEDKSIDKDIMLDNNIIRVKVESNNWSSLLIKVIKAFEFFSNNSYTHIMVANISSFINIPVLYKKLSDDCMAVKGQYNFNNIEYDFPSGAGYIFPRPVIKGICEFFSKNKYIVGNYITKEFIDNYPSTDDIFFGYYFYINKIKIEDLDRVDFVSEITNITNIDTDVSHFRVKTNDNDIDTKIFIKLYNSIYG
jgi:hypothetical protein